MWVRSSLPAADYPILWKKFPDTRKTEYPLPDPSCFRRSPIIPASEVALDPSPW